MKNKGKIKSISVNEVTEGMQVGWEGATRFHYGIIESTRDKVYALVKLFTTIGHDTVPVDLLKTLVIEYEEIEFQVTVHTKRLPLKYSQWQSAIDDGLVDSDQEVEFEVMSFAKDEPYLRVVNESIRIGIQYAQIIPQTKRMYSEKEVKDIVFKFCEWRWVNMGEQTGLLYPPALSDRWKAFKITELCKSK